MQTEQKYSIILNTEEIRGKSCQDTAALGVQFSLPQLEKERGLTYLMNPIERTTQNMPMVAMRGVVIFPKMVMHFDVARDASIQAVNAAYASDHQLFLVAQRDIFTEEPEQKDLQKYARY